MSFLALSLESKWYLWSQMRKRGFKQLTNIFLRFINSFAGTTSAKVQHLFISTTYCEICSIRKQKRHILSTKGVNHLILLIFMTELHYKVSSVNVALLILVLCTQVKGQYLNHGSHKMKGTKQDLCMINSRSDAISY